VAYLCKKKKNKKKKKIIICLDANALHESTRVGSLALTGYATPFHQQPVHIRHSILKGWQRSYLPPLQLVYKSLTAVMKYLWLKTSPTIGPTVGFPQTPIHGVPGKGFDFKFLQFPAGSHPEIIETDVVIVGSGCGGGVSAKNLAEAGHRVIVVEKSYYFSPEHMPMSQRDANIHLFENGGVMPVDDNSTNVIAGSCWGGGGTVNWCASLQTQWFVRKEWANRGLKFFESEKFQDCMDKVCHWMGVSTKYINHNHANRMILEGARKLGYTAKDVPQNTGGQEHYCGYCKAFATRPPM
jgi:hypothetical protein